MKGGPTSLWLGSHGPQKPNSLALTSFNLNYHAADGHLQRQVWICSLSEPFTGTPRWRGGERGGGGCDFTSLCLSGESCSMKVGNLWRWLLNQSVAAPCFTEPGQIGTGRQEEGGGGHSYQPVLVWRVALQEGREFVAVVTEPERGSLATAAQVCQDLCDCSQVGLLCISPELVQLGGDADTQGPCWLSITLGRLSSSFCSSCWGRRLLIAFIFHHSCCGERGHLY